MTAPTRVAGPATRTRARTQVPVRERSVAKPAALPDRAGTTRGRSTAAERAYARRTQRTQRLTGATTQPKPGSAYRVPFVVLVIGLLVAGVVATLWFATQATADSYRLEQVKQDTIGLSEQVDQLQQQVARAESPPSLAARARQLGMVSAGDPAHLVLGPDGVVTVIGQPSAPRATAPPAPVSLPTPSASVPARPDGPPAEGDQAGNNPATSAAPPRAGG